MRPTMGGDGGFRGRDGGQGGGRGGRFGGRGGGGRGYDEGPPSEVVGGFLLRYLAKILRYLRFSMPAKGMLSRSSRTRRYLISMPSEKMPYFNAPIYLENKTQIGKVDEIFGPINEAFFSIKMLAGIIANSYSTGDKFFIDPAKLLPLARFLPRPNLSSHFLVISCWGKREPQEVVVVAEEVEAVEVDVVEAFVEEAALGVVEGDLLEVGMVASEAAEGHRVCMHVLIICLRGTPSLL
ncbi:hypothetical protein ZIOFF_053240 [Zingiber officinale]|uniref:H/ACA ribonucleoprotein complex subunit n=1 Tax=Zingiber officinale TaxID=94328 RepID=A0A8J5FID6_ZINOF|nr:hypothetical protein ZIOFF_053240 [Zingiber officinale]